MNRAYGFVEIIGMASAVVAVDTALKAANVTLEGLEPAKGQGMHTLKLAGNVGAVNAAVSSILGSPELANKVWSHTVIARPSKGLGIMIHGKDDVMEKESLEVQGVYEEKTKKSSEASGDEEVLEESHDEESDNQLDKNEDESSQENLKDNDNDENIHQEKEEENSSRELLDEPSPSEFIKEAAHKSKSSDDTKDHLEDKQYTCNLCKDEKCPRIKGEPRVKCIHYNEKE
ncbi:MAG: BMC domain-containing protein [Clostridium sp.]|nr:BMC domain-containing protein [Clostridium sp.]